jgi:hypothetical protein
LGHEAAGTHFRVSVANFFGAFGPRLGDVEARRSVGGDGGTDGRGIRCWGHEKEMGATGTHFLVSVADFLGGSAHGWVTLRLGEALVVMDGRTGGEFDVGGMRRRWGRRAPIFLCP